MDMNVLASASADHSEPHSTNKLDRRLCALNPYKLADASLSRTGDRKTCEHSAALHNAIVNDSIRCCPGLTCWNHPAVADSAASPCIIDCCGSKLSLAWRMLQQYDIRIDRSSSTAGESWHVQLDTLIILKQPLSSSNWGPCTAQMCLQGLAAQPDVICPQLMQQCISRADE